MVFYSWDFSMKENDLDRLQFRLVKNTFQKEYLMTLEEVVQR
jgi:hypothetical protein